MPGVIERITDLRQPRLVPGREAIPCPLCGAVDWRSLGVRGNREYTGADPSASPHLFTNVARCRSCDFVFANPPIEEAVALEAAHYGDAEVYQATSSEALAVSMFGDRLELIARHVRGRRVLDVGAGKGEFLLEARRRGFEVQGIEPQRALAACAREAELPVRHGVLDDTIEDGSFDVVTLNHVLEHVARPRELLARVSRVLAPGGALFVEVPNVDAHLARGIDLWFRARGRDWSCRLSPVHPPFHSFGYTPRSLRWVLEREGWEIRAMETRSGQGRGTSGQGLWGRTVIRAAFAAFSALGNRELLLAVAAPRAARP